MRESNRPTFLTAEDLRTGSPVTFLYHRNLKKSPFMGARFGQHIEPHGEYLSYHEPGSTSGAPDYEYGTITFLNPLVVSWENSEHPMDHNSSSWGWKSLLMNQFGASGSELSDKLKSLGFDGIITTGAFGPNTIGEIVNLAGIKKAE